MASGCGGLGERTKVGRGTTAWFFAATKRLCTCLGVGGGGRLCS